MPLPRCRWPSSVAKQAVPYLTKWLPEIRELCECLGVAAWKMRGCLAGNVKGLCKIRDKAKNIAIQLRKDPRRD